MGIQIGKPGRLIVVQQLPRRSHEDLTSVASIQNIHKMPIISITDNNTLSAQLDVSTQIDKWLHREKDEDQQRVKMLLLGGADAGKSTIVKQMRIIHMNGFDAEELHSFQTYLRANLCKIFRALAIGILHSNVFIEDSEKATVYRFSEDLSWMNRAHETIQYLKDFHSLACVQHFIDLYPNFSSLPDNSHYYLPNLSSLLSPDYIPTATDILHLRIPTTSVNEINFNFAKSSIRLIDVGGQRSYRKKWIHCFDGCAAVLFVASMAAYDQCLEGVDSAVKPVLHSAMFTFEADKDLKGESRLRDSAKLFAEMLRSNFLSSAAFILFLNKRDIFLKKLSSSPLAKYFEYNGATDKEAEEFIKEYFLKRKSKADKDRMIYSHFTCATDTKNVEFVFKASCDIALMEILHTSGLQ